MKKFYRNKKILITGAAGTVGREIARQVSSFGPAELRLMDNNESEMFFLMEEYKNKNTYCFLGDIRDRDKLEKLSKDIDIIIHSAAFKHVILSEYNPFDVVQTNIIGVENVIKAATACNVKRLLFTSSDKAVNPTNVMGTSKLMGERLITAANALIKDSKTIFSSTRFGNVLGSRGSVVPLFMKQIRNGGPVTITDKKMTRFVMTIEEAARSVLQSVPIAKGGEVVVTPAFKSIYQSIGCKYPGIISQSQKSYISHKEKPLSKEELQRYLVKNSVLENYEECFCKGAD
ncbi:MAG: SDR family NAD(P)-dependent oxidoreductase [Nitrospirae bacterium]|nr:SDR family NAD(P)-dependent oxidoreductase [Nitrospirota bacterium]